jgi:hypothetical protein
MTDIDTELVARKSIQEIWLIKCDLLAEYAKLNAADQRIEKLMEQINNYSNHDLDYRNCNYHGQDDRIEKEIDRDIWHYLIKFYHLEKYMLCTEYDKLRKQIDDYNFPQFNLDNANQWLAALKKTVYENVQQLIEDVFNRITQQTYYTGQGQRTKKKRNNNGIDKCFIITTHDHNHLGWHDGKPTITDDLEKACYIIDGKQLPDITIKSALRREKRWEGENDYFKILICKNGNTHYWIKDEIRNKLNLYGARKGIIGENIRIKVFEDRF